MRKILVLFLCFALTVPLFAQVGDPGRTPRWDRALAYIKGGQFTMTYKTLTSPKFDGNTYFTSDGDTLKIIMYQALYPIDLEIGNSRVFGVDSTGLICGPNAGTLSNITDGSWILADGGEDLKFAFTSNAVTLSSSTGVADFSFGAIDINMAAGGAFEATSADSFAFGTSSYFRKLGRTTYGDSLYIVVWAKHTGKDTVFFALR
jgi:hypothetical protein